MANIRAELICRDGSVVNIDDIVLMTDKRHIFVERMKSYKDVISFDVVLKRGARLTRDYSSDELTEIRREVCFKSIEKIIVYASTMHPETDEMFEYKLQEYIDINKSYCVSDVYRTIDTVDNDVNNTIHYVLYLNTGSLDYANII